MDVSNPESVAAFLKDPLSVDDAAIATMLQDETQEESAPPGSAEAELASHLGAEEQARQDDEAAAKAAEKAADEKTAESSPATAQAEGEKSETTSDEKPDGILAKDGKNVIPYSVLQKEREERKRLEDLAREQAEKIAKLQAQAEGGQTDLSPDVEVLDEATLKDLEENAPTLAKVFRGMQQQITELRGKTETVAQQAAQKTSDLVQETIDSIPKLAYVQAENVDAFNAIAGFDAILRSDPKFASMSLDKRFVKAVAMYEAAHGAIDVPGSPTETAPPPEKPDPKAVQAKAEAALRKAEEEARPNTLSDIPGGEPPASNQLENLDGVSAHKLTTQFLNMTPAQIEQYLGRLA